MVFHCVVYKCTNRQTDESKERGLSFFRFPKNHKKRKAWVKSINRENWHPNEYSRICSAHFVDGWHSDDSSDVNFRPTIFSYKEKTLSENEKSRTSRQLKRSLLQEMNEVEEFKRRRLESDKAFSLYVHDSYCLPVNQEKSGKSFKDIGIQCNLTNPLLEENTMLKRELEEERKMFGQYKWGVGKIKDNDERTRFYTGLPSFAVFLWLFNFIQEKAFRMKYWIGQKTDSTTDRQRCSTGSSMELIDQLFAVLMRLRLGLFVTDISERFSISEATFSKYFSTWICLLEKELKSINPFPSRDIIDRTMPKAFKDKYPTTRIILDCTELFIQRSSSLLNQSLTFSSYKHHTTIKFLIGITPSGVISFVSEGWPGKTSDRQLTIESGLLEMLDKNDSIMADKGFTIGDVLQAKGCSLNIPPFQGSNPQFTTEEVYETQEIATLRIHVERSIGRVKNFHILNGVMPITLQPLSTNIFKVICWLTNLDVPLVN